MKKTLQFLAGAVLAAALFALLNLTLSDPAHAAGINRSDPLPAVWYGLDGTNGFALSSVGAPIVTRSGTNISGITTNLSLALTNGVFTLSIVKGIIVGP